MAMTGGCEPIYAAPLHVPVSFKPTVTDDDRESLPIKKCPSHKKGTYGFQLGRIQDFSFQSFSQSTNTCFYSVAGHGQRQIIHGSWPQGAHRLVARVHRYAAKGQGQVNRGARGEWQRAPEPAWGDDQQSGKAFSRVAYSSPPKHVHWA